MQTGLDLFQPSLDGCVRSSRALKKKVRSVRPPVDPTQPNPVGFDLIGYVGSSPNPKKKKNEPGLLGRFQPNRTPLGWPSPIY
jgi:hypothetical protein